MLATYNWTVSSSTRLLLVRHGRTDPQWQSDTKLCGWYDPPLGLAGQEDAGRAASKLRAGGPYSVLYTSPLRRAQESANVIAAELGLSIVSVADLGEIRCGVLDGEPFRVIQEEHPEIWEKNLAQCDEGFRWPGGESYSEFRKRVDGGLSAIAESHVRTNVIIVTHYGVIAQAIGTLEGISPARWDIARPAHGSVTEIRWGSGGPESAMFW